MCRRVRSTWIRETVHPKNVFSHIPEKTIGEIEKEVCTAALGHSTTPKTELAQTPGARATAFFECVHIYVLCLFIHIISFYFFMLYTTATLCVIIAAVCAMPAHEIVQRLVWLGHGEVVPRKPPLARQVRGRMRVE